MESDGEEYFSFEDELSEDEDIPGLLFLFLIQDEQAPPDEASGSDEEDQGR